MNCVDYEFRRRASLLPHHGTGLSVDAYSPNLLDVCRELEVAGLEADYLEIFKAPATELKEIRDAFPKTVFAYHAEGLWLVNPDMMQTPWRTEVDTIARHARILRAGWINHECATKQFGGYAFGTYLPPLFTRPVAGATAAHVTHCQQRLDAWFDGSSLPAPLLILELPPLTYFGFGDVSPAEFFAWLAMRTSCGFVLDIGHLWTLWRYRERRRGITLDGFVEEFLAVFPMERVIQIHLAGLASPEGDALETHTPWWIDAHAARVPEVLWDLLRRVVAAPRLTALKGVALEVDTKAIPVIVDEFRRLRHELADWSPCGACDEDPRPQLVCKTTMRDTATATQEMPALYRAYARVISGQESLEDSVLVSLAGCVDKEGLDRYVTTYLPCELLTWGGDLEQLFPQVWHVLRSRSIGAEDFVRFWFAHTLDHQQGYDFFHIKLNRWIAFVRSVEPEVAEKAEQEARTLLALHTQFNLDNIGA